MARSCGLSTSRTDLRRELHQLPHGRSPVDPPLASYDAVQIVAKADTERASPIGRSVSHSPVRHQHHIPADRSDFRPERNADLDPRQSRCRSLPDHSS